MGPKDPINNRHFPESSRRVAALPTCALERARQVAAFYEGTFRPGTAEVLQNVNILPYPNLPKTPNPSEINFKTLIINFNIYGMGPKDPISNRHFLVPVRKMAALPPAHWIKLVKKQGSTKTDLGQGGRKCLKSLKYYPP